ncbi:MAG: hydroxyectoine utilization dehydratase EutB [Pseudomonadota bacterium]
MTSDLTLNHIMLARHAITGVADNTPLIPSPYLTERSGVDFLLKLELAQPIGAFKLRGALNAVSNLQADPPGVTCSSTGNHGRGVAFAAAARGVRAVICMSRLVPEAKVAGIRSLGAEVRIIGESQDDAQVEVDRLVAEEGLVDINPFDDPFVIAGQGTVGLELMERRPDLETLLIPLSGGGLAGGTALAAKSIKPSIRIIGVTMDRGAAMHQSIAAGHPVEVEELPSLADSLGGGIGADNRHSLDLCSRYLDETVLVTEEEIYRALQAIYFEDRLICEGGCAVGVAALLAGKVTPRGPTATVLTGRNIDMVRHSDIMQGRDVQLGDYLLKGAPYQRA